MLEVRDLSVRYGELTILNGVHFSVEAGQWLMVVGPNGAGKSTLVDAVSQGGPFSGEILFDGHKVAAMKKSTLAMNMGVLLQSHNVGYSFTVEEVVRLGRYAYSGGIFSEFSQEDSEKVEEALSLTGMLPMRGQSVLTLSGGELQRTFLAQLLAQNPRLLILDEPANHLDLVYQKQVFDLIQQWLLKPRRAVISVVHDLSLAKAYGTHAMLLNKGDLVAFGRCAEVLRDDVLRKIYDMDVAAWMRSMLAQWE